MRRFILLTTIALIFISSCNQPKQADSDDQSRRLNDSITTAKPSISINDSLTLFYKILAGVNERNDSASAPLKTQWEKMNANLLSPIQHWKDSTLPQECINANFILYPFSGPDFVFPNTIFGKFNRMVMFGLEKPGTDISNNGYKYAENLVPKMQESLIDYFGKSYFITKNMIKHLNTDTISGVTPLIASFIVYSGYSLISIRNFHLDSNGNKQYYVPENQKESTEKISGVEFKYTNNGNDEKSIEYLSFNAEDAYLKNHEEIMKFLNSTVPDNVTTYIKSASYLLHYGSFSRIRQLCLQKSKFLLQDDTGIPYKYLKDNFDLSLFGIYEKPIKDFSGVFQSDLDSVYSRSKRVSLPFNLGYHYFTRNQNLIFGKRK